MSEQPIQLCNSLCYLFRLDVRTLLSDDSLLKERLSGYVMIDLRYNCDVLSKLKCSMWSIISGSQLCL